MKKNNKEAIEFAKYYYDWIEFATTTNSSHTVRTYQYSIKLYVQFLEETKKISTSSFCMSDSFCAANVKEWQVWMEKKRSCKAQSCNARMSALRSFLRYVGDKDIKYRHLALEAACVQRLKEEKRQIDAISKDAIRTLLQMPNPSTTTGFRDCTLLSFLYGTAARIDEVLSLKIRDLHLDGAKSYAVVTGKGRKTRTLFIQKKLAQNLRIYIKKFHSGTIDGEHLLFYSRVGGYNNKLTQAAVNKRLRIYAKQAHEICKDVPLDMHAHIFRHSCAKHWLEDGMNIVQVSKLLGHSNISTTMTYLSITIDAKSMAVMALEDEDTRKLPKKWKNDDGTLSSLLELK